MDRAVTADASSVSARSFFDAMTGRTDAQRAEERRQMDEQCIRAIRRGDTYGWPPSTVNRCRQIIAERDAEQIVEVEWLAGKGIAA